MEKKHLRGVLHSDQTRLVLIVKIFLNFPSHNMNKGV